MKRTDRSVVGSLFGGTFCSIGFGHVILLFGCFGFCVCKCLAYRRWAERDRQTHHRTRLQKASSRSVVLLHGMALSGRSGFCGCESCMGCVCCRECAVIASSLRFPWNLN